LQTCLTQACCLAKVCGPPAEPCCATSLLTLRLQAAAAKAAQVAEAKRLREEQQRQEAMQQLLEGKQ
jgi:hypothetical protein